MCYPVHDSNMIEWLRTQVRVLEAWRESIALKPQIDIELLSRVEDHYQWLTREIQLLETAFEPEARRA
ncbi:MAG: hypothetical protein QNI84_07305 [Henriciella sp.]|nr:hypothetical protein [Henriciella sp.]